MNQPVSVIATFTPGPGKEDDVENILRGMIEPTRGEAGCQRYDFYRTSAAPGLFMLFEAPNQSGGSHILSYAKSGMPDVSSTLIGTTEEIHDKLVALNEAGVEHVILSVLGGSRYTLWRFADEIIPEFNSAVGREKRLSVG
jgi:hypothetical protein